MAYKVTKTTVSDREKEKQMAEKPTCSIPVLSEEEYKEQINLNFKQDKVYLKIIEEAVNALTEKGRSQLPELIGAIKQGLKPEFKKDASGNIVEAKFGGTLSDDDLENYVLYLPVEMFSALDFIQSKALDAEYSDYMAELRISEKLLSVSGGTVQERQKIAELESMFPSITAIIKKRVYQNIKAEVDAANRVYEALKKIMQARIDDKKVFGKNVNMQS